MKMLNSKHIASFLLLSLFMFFAIGTGDEEGSDGSDSGEIVKNSSWDSSVSQVEAYLDHNLNDPGSVEYELWSAVEKCEDDKGRCAGQDIGTFYVRCRYRAKNGFGAMIIQDQVFYMDKDDGHVLYALPYVGK